MPTTVKDLLRFKTTQKDIKTIEESKTLSEAWGILHEHHFNQLPVVDEQEHLVGTVCLPLKI